MHMFYQKEKNIAGMAKKRKKVNIYVDFSK